MSVTAVPVQFVNDDPIQAQTDAINDYQLIAGRTLGNSDPEMLVINSFALRLAQMYSQINATGNQNLVAFATGIALEQIGYKFGIFRLDASAAQVAIIYTIAGAPGTVFIPAGTRVKSNDGLVLFATNADVTAGNGTVSIDSTCLTAGAVGNGYAAGLISSIVDPIAYVTAATNADTTTGGSDEETDDQLRARIPQANATFSVAGPHDAYIYFAKTASASIVDVNPTTPAPGTVALYVLLADGTVPDSAILDAVLAVCSDKKVRPLCDIVQAYAAVEVDYSLVINLTLKSNAPAGTQGLVLASVNGFVNQWGTGLGSLGVDVVVDQVKGVCMLPGVYSVDIPSLVSDLPIDDTQFAKCLGVTVNVVAIVDEL